MYRKQGSLKKINHKLKHINIVNYLIILFLISSTAPFCFCYNNSLVEASSFTPVPPDGITNGDINIEYEFSITAGVTGSKWIFDWGDGNFSNWIEVEESDEYIKVNYSWSSYGEYNVRVKRRNIYDIESEWSDPLIVRIEASKDLDEDGWENIIEESYGTDPHDPDDYPVDTDADGIPDDDSIDSKYIGDMDDDGDGVDDIKEQEIGTNSKNSQDIEIIPIGDENHYLLDKNNDGTFDTFYNTEKNIETEINYKNNLMYLDVDGDSKTDYTYQNGTLTFYQQPFEIPWWLLIASIITVVILIILILFKKGIFYVYEEEYIVEE